MAKKETTEPVENLFEGFNFLNNQVPKSATKKATSKEVTNDVQDDDLSEEELSALEATAEAIKSKKSPIKNFKKEIEDEEESDETPKVVEDVDDSNEFGGFAKFLAEEGVIDLEADSEPIKTEKDLAKVVNNTIKKGIESYKSSKPEDAQKFLDFIDNGGKPSDFHKYYYGEASFEDFDITSEENQKYVITEALRLEEYSDEEIQEALIDFDDTGKLDKKAEMYLKKLQKIEKGQKALLIETQKSYAKEQEKIREAEWDSFKKGLFDKDEIGGFKMTPKMKEDTWTYMTKIVDKSTGETQYQKDSKENTDARYIFAYLLKNKWDMKALERQIQSKEVSKLKNKLTNYSDTRDKLKSPANKIELMNDENNPFAGFKKVLG